MRRLCTIVALILSTTLTSAAQAPEIERRIDSILSQMTLEEKIDLLGGVDGFFIRDIPRLNLPRLKMADGPIGIRNFGPATSFAAGVGLSATWNPALAELVGIELGRDARAKGVHYEVSFDVKNTGTREGADVAQVYVGDMHTKVPRPARELKGFRK